MDKEEIGCSVDEKEERAFSRKILCQESFTEVTFVSTLTPGPFHPFHFMLTGTLTPTK